MKLLLIANCIYLPFNLPNSKYVSGSISGNIFLNEIYTIEEIKEKHKDSNYPLIECDDLHDLCKKWGTKL